MYILYNEYDSLLFNNYWLLKEKCCSIDMYLCYLVMLNRLKVVY